jgi:alkylation response protein AidB-like acyl-CoA dehydrogenase
MRFELSDDQQLLRSSTRDFFTKAAPLEHSRRIMEHDARGFEAPQWRQLAEMGYVGLVVAADRGGQGVGAVELAVVAEEVGRVCLPGPWLDAVLAAALLAQAKGQDELLRQVCEGHKIATIARLDAPFAGAAEPAVRVDGGTLHGTKYFVPFAGAADALCVVTPAGIVLATGPFDVTPTPTIDLAQRFGTVAFDHVATPLGPASLLEGIDRLGAVGAGAMLLGIMQRCLETTLAYVNTRAAFSRPIGAFQVLQHRLANMLLRVESTRSAVYRAAWCLDANHPDAALACPTAKAYAGDAARLVCGETIQMHGGIGFTWELDVHVFFKRAKTLEQFYGSTEEQLERALGASGYLAG